MYGAAFGHGEIGELVVWECMVWLWNLWMMAKDEDCGFVCEKGFESEY